MILALTVYGLIPALAYGGAVWVLLRFLSRWLGARGLTMLGALALLPPVWVTQPYLRLCAPRAGADAACPEVLARTLSFVGYVSVPLALVLVLVATVQVVRRRN